MAPDYRINIEENDFKKLIRVADTFGINYSIIPQDKNVNIIPSRESIKSKYLEIPSIGLAVPKERTLLNKNFYDSQKILHDNKTKMLSMNEFREFLKVAKEKDAELYNEITQVRSPWRAEWIDADFKYKNGEMFVDYHVFDENGNIQKKREKLDKETLMKDKIPGISLEKWINDSTNQGLPKNSEGSLYYWAPDKDNNSVAGFYADSIGASLNGRIPSYWDANLGVRAAEQLK
jgi:hypothetical protein